MTTRRRLLRAAGAGLLTPLAAAVAAAPAAADAEAADRPAAASDGARLARVLDVEQLMLYVYGQVLAGPRLTAAQRASLAPLRRYEATHVAVLRRAVAAHGAAAPPPPGSPAQANRRLARRDVAGRLDQLRDDRDAVNLLLATERVTVGVYYEALIDLTQPATIALAAQLMASDAEHESILLETLALTATPPPERVDVLRSGAPYPLVQGVR